MFEFVFYVDENFAAKCMNLPKRHLFNNYSLNYKNRPIKTRGGLMKKSIAVLPGDGIGPEVVKEGVKALRAIERKFNHEFFMKECLVGGIAYDKTGHPLPKETIETCKASDAIFFGAVGGPKWEKLPAELTPERGALLPLRKMFDLFANLRPATIFPSLAEAASLKKDRLQGGLDILIVRELTGGIYFGKKETATDHDGLRCAVDEMRYDGHEIWRILEVACKASFKRNKKLTSVDKANVLETSKFWREIASNMIPIMYPNLELNHMYVDNAAMQLGTRPTQFDVIVTENMFGDILSDLAAAITGSLGMLPSASLNSNMFGLYEPIHGSAPDKAGKGIANPLATILSAAMMLRYSFGMNEEGEAVQNAVSAVLEKGYRTIDIADKETPKEKILSTSQMGDVVCEEIMG